MKACGIIDTFLVLRAINFAKIFEKVLDPTLCVESVPGLVPEIYVSFRFLWNIQVAFK